MAQLYRYQADAISIHTPARGVTLNAKSLTQYHVISIHTPARGVTSETNKFPGQIIISIHTPARGVTTNRAAVDLYLRFQSTLPQGE